MRAFGLLTEKTAGLLGFGKSNQALLDFLLGLGMSVTVREARPHILQGLPARGLRVISGEGCFDELQEDYLFRSPSIRPDLPSIRAAIARGACLSGEYDLFAENCPATLLGITGSDGKTTTTTVAGLMLQACGHTVHVGGNIGRPLISSLTTLGKGDFAVAEVSSFQLMSTPRAPRRAVITNITENHLNWHTDMAEYVAAKQKILGPATHAILNADNPYTAAIARCRADKTVFSATADSYALRGTFGTCHTVTCEGGWVCYDQKPLFHQQDILLPGSFNLQNYLAAIGLVYPYLRDMTAPGRVSSSFGGVPHRLERIAVLGGVSYYNSSIDSTPTRTAAALDALGGRMIVLCGGADKGLSFAPLRQALSVHASYLLLFGAARQKIRDALQGMPIPIEEFSHMAQAVTRAKAIARPGDRVVLSPACTSFDEFTDFEARGKAFCRAVLGHKK